MRCRVQIPPYHSKEARLTVDAQLPSPINDPLLKCGCVMDSSLPQDSSVFREWGNYHLLLLASAVKRHGTGNWSRILQELKSCALKNGIPYAFSAEACEQEFDAWRGQPRSSSSDSRDHEICDTMLAELTRQRVAHLKRELEVYEENIGSLQRKIRKLEVERAQGLAHNRPPEKSVGQATADSVITPPEYDLACSSRDEVAACEMSYSLPPAPMKDMPFKSRQAMEVAFDAVGEQPPEKAYLDSRFEAKEDVSAQRSSIQGYLVGEINVEVGSSAGLYCEHPLVEEAGREQDRVEGNPCVGCTYAVDIALDLATENGGLCGDADQGISGSRGPAAGFMANSHSYSADEISSISSSEELQTSDVLHVRHSSASKLTAGSSLVTTDSILVHVLEEHIDKAGSTALQGFKMADSHKAFVPKIGESCGKGGSASLLDLSKELHLSEPNTHNSPVTCTNDMPCTEASISCKGEQVTSIVSPPGPLAHPFCEEAPASVVNNRLPRICVSNNSNQDEQQGLTLSNVSPALSLTVPCQTEALSCASACSALPESRLSGCSTQPLHVDNLQGTTNEGIKNCLRTANMLVETDFFDDSASLASQQTADVQPTAQLQLVEHFPCNGVSAIPKREINCQLLTQSEEVARMCGDEVGKPLLINEVDKFMKIGREITEGHREEESKQLSVEDTDQHRACPYSSSMLDPTGFGASHETMGTANELFKDIDDTDELQGSRNSGYTQIEKSEAGSPFEGADDTSPLSRRNKREPRVAGKLLPLLDCLRAICMHKFAPLFKQKQGGQEEGRYHHLIRRHMDLSMIRCRLEEGVYSGSLEFFRDLLLIFNNALVYYERDAPEHVAARVLRDAAMHEMRKIFETEALLKQDGPSTRNREPKKAVDSVKVMTQSAPGDGKRRGSLRLSSMDNRSTDSTLDFEDVSKKESICTMGPSNNGRCDEAGILEAEIDERWKEVKTGGRNIRLKDKDPAESGNKKPSKGFGRSRTKIVKEELPSATKASMRSKAKEDANMAMEVKRCEKISSKCLTDGGSDQNHNRSSASELKTSKKGVRLQASSQVVQGKSRPARISKRPASAMQVSKETKRPPHMQLKKRIRR